MDCLPHGFENCTECAPLYAEIARLTAERDAAIETLKARDRRCAFNCMGYPSEGVRHWVAKEALDAAIARAERAERVAIVVGRRVQFGNIGVFQRSVGIYDDGVHDYEFDGTDADLYRALVEASEGGRDGE